MHSTRLGTYVLRIDGYHYYFHIYQLYLDKSMKKGKNKMYMQSIPVSEQMDISANCRRIKQFARCNLIMFTEHAKNAMKERKISQEDVLSLLRNPKSSIVQHHPKGTYNGNSSPVDVMFGQVRNKNNKFFLHVVVATESSLNGGIAIKVVTTYVPSNEFFYARGRKLKKR